MNPYASFLGDRNLTEVIAATMSELGSIMEAMGVDQLDQPRAPGKWSPREILCHLADCEVVFAFRLRQTIAEDRHIMQPFDQDRFSHHYGAYEARAALAVFSSLRRWNMTFLTTIPPESWSKPTNHPERGDMTFRAIVETMAGHDLNHLQQLHAASR